MTKAEAIDLLQSRVDLIKKDYPDIADYAEALEMAIEALNQFAGVGKKVSAEGQDSISRQVAISHVDDVPYIKEHPNVGLLWKAWIESLPAAQPEKRAEERTETHACDLIDRQAAINELMDWVEKEEKKSWSTFKGMFHWTGIKAMIECLSSAQIEQRYTEEELRVFQHGISLSLLSKKSAQRWRYDEDMATEIKFLERLYEKVGADMRGEKDG